MNEKAIAKAVVPEPWTILGLKLKPFALGHLILLQRIESAFVLGGEPTYNDLALSVLICSQTFEDAIDSMQDPGLDKFMADWANKLTKREPIDLVAKSQQFAAYLDEGRLTDDDLYFTYDPARTRPSMIPQVHGIRVRVQAGLHLSDTEILNRGWWLCVLDDHVLKDMAGIIELTDKSDIEDARNVADKLQAMIAEGKIKWQ